MLATTPRFVIPSSDNSATAEAAVLRLLAYVEISSPKSPISLWPSSHVTIPSVGSSVDCSSENAVPISAIFP